jgi:molybdenum cofactor biosynthesis enzyme MoaA
MSLLPAFDDLPGRHARLEAAWKRLDPKLRLPTQSIGRRYTVACVAVEITQRCNLDCTLCYLSESSEKVKDIPLEIVLARLAKVRETYGDGVSVQITGGDPTLRKRSELVAIVREAARLGLEPSLMTNGIKLTRDLAQELKAAGLFDAAIHVDLTQERKGYPTEESLNAVRKEYVERVRGLGLHVIFNTTVFDGNIREIPALISFFKEHADVIGMASFQIQADTGRGVLHDRSDVVTLQGVRRAIAEACGGDLSWDSVRVGHPDCNSLAFTLVANGRVIDLLKSKRMLAAILRDLTDYRFGRSEAMSSAWKAFRFSVQRPRLVALLLANAAVLGVRHARALWPARRDLKKLTFVIHNFMDAKALVRERVANCSFMVATDGGFVSMCAHNAAREAFIRKPLEVRTDMGLRIWDPLTGQLVEAVGRPLPAANVLPSALSEIPVSTLPVAAGGR